MRPAAELGYATATDLADWLVREANIPFREAPITSPGGAVKLAESRGVALHELPLDQLQVINPNITDRGLEGAVGGIVGEEPRQLWRTAPKNVLAQAKAWAKRLEKSENWAERKISRGFQRAPPLARAKQCSLARCSSSGISS